VKWRPPSETALARLVVMPSSPPKKRSKMSADAAIISAMPSEIMAKTVPARLVEKLPTIAAKSRPPTAPTRGTRGTGSQRPCWAARFRAWAAKKPPRPK
jgi:hypothetical protein